MTNRGHTKICRNSCGFVRPSFKNHWVNCPAVRNNDCKRRIWMDPYGNSSRFGQLNKACWSLRQDCFYRNWEAIFDINDKMWSPLTTPWRALKILEGTACAGKVLFVWAKFREPLNLSSLSWLTRVLQLLREFLASAIPFVHIESLYVWHMDPANWCKKMKIKRKTRKRKERKKERGRWNTCHPSINRTDHDYIVLQRN